MCGWVAVLGRVVAKDNIVAAGALLASRGPDGSGVHLLDGPLPGGLAHRRLSIIDLSPAGAQPMVDEDSGTVIAYNGEIYNSPELRRRLQAKGARFRSGSDTEVLLKGWAEWGDSVLHEIEGIFSFALVDQRRGRALIARDRVGVKPLYWARMGDAVIAASAPRAILELAPELRSELDPVALAQFCTLLWVPHPRTPWTGIDKLPPGHCIVMDTDGEKVRKWWSPPEPERDTDLDPISLRTAIDEAADRQLLSDVPVGLLLSGGLDSTLLLRLRRLRHPDDHVHALTATYDAQARRLEINPDDCRYARSVADADTDVELREVDVSAVPDEEIDRLASQFDDPVADPAAVTLGRLCARSPTKVLLSGVGGEELFAGYPRHRALGVARRLAALPAPLRVSAARLAPLLVGGRSGPLHSTRRNAQKLLRSLSGAERPHYWRLMSQLTSAELDSLLPGSSVVAAAELDAQTPALASADLSEALRFDRDQFLPNLNLAYVDRASMSVGVEVRVPLLDEKVLSLVHRAGVTGLVRGGDTKAPLRDAAREVVPHEVLNRPKSGLGGPVRHWITGPGRGPMRERVEALGDTGLLDGGAALRVFDAAAAGSSDSTLAAWALVCMQAWHETHVRRPC